MRQRGIPLLIVTLTFGVGAWAQSPASPSQVLKTLTPQQIQEAIALGMSKARGKKLPLYRIWSPSSQIASYTTPFLRVAFAAAEAASVYKPFGAADVTPDMVAPEVLIYAPSINVRAAVYDVRAIFVFSKGSKDPTQAIRPLRTSPLEDHYKNLFGYTAEGNGLVAAFPIAVVIEAYEVRIVMASGPEQVGGFKTMNDVR